MRSMNHTLTVGDLLLPGEPLDPAEVLAGESRLSNAVSWVASLRPFPPAFPRLRGGELALVAVENLARLEPPTTLADVVRQLVSREAAAVAVRGEVDSQAVEAAHEGGLPLLSLQDDTPLHDIEQAIMRVCALYQARSEMLPTEGEGAWVELLLAGRIRSVAEAQSLARRQGVRLASHYSVVYLPLPDGAKPDEVAAIQGEVEARLASDTKGQGATPLVQAWEGGVALLVPQGAQEAARDALAGLDAPCGIGEEKPLLDVPDSLAEAQMASIASALLNGGRPVRYSEMGADRLLVLLWRDYPDELRAFVEETLGPLREHDEVAAMPLLETLESFVAHGGRLRETASDMYVHRNTLAYRLDRAAEILGADLREPRTRLAIELALRARGLVGGMREEGGRTMDDGRRTTSDE
jgi:hypothetical protein